MNRDTNITVKQDIQNIILSYIELANEAGDLSLAAKWTADYFEALAVHQEGVLVRLVQESA